MGLDFQDIAKMVDFEDLNKVLKTYQKHKTVIDAAFGWIIKLFRKNPNGTTVVKNEDGSIVVAPGEKPGKDTAESLYAELDAKAFFLELKNVPYKKEYFKDVLNPEGSNAQMVNDRMHLDITPRDAKGNEITSSMRHPIDDEGNPALRYRWWINGEQQQDSNEDHFHLGSVLDDNGCTPVLRLTSAFGPGRHTVTFQAYIPADWNGGVEVESNIVTWFCD